MLSEDERASYNGQLTGAQVKEVEAVLVLENQEEEKKEEGGRGGGEEGGGRKRRRRNQAPCAGAWALFVLSCAACEFLVAPFCVWRKGREPLCMSVNLGEHIVVFLFMCEQLKACGHVRVRKCPSAFL